eukprot:TRINITY_DN6347_c0_g1_i6.p1 TRINITY_DN6347_c0_g1~~TRINITY_DN6347_c0_g1_i6.p1  ORF type:complete len:315 (-),score=44.69 TRINITY_DN6347_c0_g1_i6:111-1055(-)
MSNNRTLSTREEVYWHYLYRHEDPTQRVIDYFEAQTVKSVRFERDGAIIPECLLSGLINLDSLAIARSRLKTLPARLLRNLECLRTIVLSFNQLETLPQELFQDCKNLDSIYLNSNLLKTLPARIFEGLTKLDFINLGDNKLISLPSGLFRGLSNLRILALERNELECLLGDTFDGTRLTSLNLANNQLVALPEGIFRSLAELQLVDVSSNRLSHLPFGLFLGNHLLKFLSVEGNPELEAPIPSFWRGMSCQFPTRAFGSTEYEMAVRSEMRMPSNTMEVWRFELVRMMSMRVKNLPGLMDWRMILFLTMGFLG